MKFYFMIIIGFWVLLLKVREQNEYIAVGAKRFFYHNRKGREP